jgi:hypothetical protein
MEMPMAMLARTTDLNRWDGLPISLSLPCFGLVFPCSVYRVSARTALNWQGKDPNSS